MESNDATSVELKICRCQIWISPEYLRVLQVIFLYHPENQELDKMAENFEKKKKKRYFADFCTNILSSGADMSYLELVTLSNILHWKQSCSKKFESMNLDPSIL